MQLPLTEPRLCAGRWAKGNGHSNLLGLYPVPMLRVKNEAQGGGETAHPASPRHSLGARPGLLGPRFHCYATRLGGPCPALGPPCQLPGHPERVPPKGRVAHEGRPGAGGASGRAGNASRACGRSRCLLSGRWRMPDPSLRCQLDGTGRGQLLSSHSQWSRVLWGGGWGVSESSDSSQLVITVLRGQTKPLRLRAQGAGRAGEDPGAPFSGSETARWGRAKGNIAKPAAPRPLRKGG